MHCNGQVTTNKNCPFQVLFRMFLEHIIICRYPVNLIHTLTQQSPFQFLPNACNFPSDTFWRRVLDDIPDGPATGSVDDFSIADEDTSTADFLQRSALL